MLVSWRGERSPKTLINSLWTLLIGGLGKPCSSVASKELLTQSDISLSKQTMHRVDLETPNTVGLGTRYPPLDGPQGRAVTLYLGDPQHEGWILFKVTSHPH